jgi:predicted O-linked N-acetylglucosamine transferase (SPINDLY family)
VLFELQRYAEAIPDYERFLARDPGHAYSAGNLIFCKLQCCDWTSLEHDRRVILARLRAGQRVVPPVLSAALLETPEDQLIAAQVLVRDKFPAAPPLWRGEAYRHERIRVAYVSADLHAHATAVLMAGVFEHHDRAKFETFAISIGRDDGSPLRRLKQGAERASAFWSAIRIARLMRGLEIDIAVDLRLHIRRGRRCFHFGPRWNQLSDFPVRWARRSWTICRRSDRRSETHKPFPANRSSGFSTRIRQTTERGGDAPFDRRERRIAAVRFCVLLLQLATRCTVFDVWMRLLKGVEGSVLWLLADSAVAANHLKREASARGIDPERLVFAPRLPLPEHLARHRLADLFLDTLPYNAHTTASDALWMGLPVLTCRGTTFAGRVWRRRFTRQVSRSW